MVHYRLKLRTGAGVHLNRIRPKQWLELWFWELPLLRPPIVEKSIQEDHLNRYRHLNH